MGSKKKTFSSAVNQWFQTLGFLRIYEIYEHSIDPTSCFYRIESADDDIELHVVLVIFVLNLSIKTVPSVIRRNRVLGSMGSAHGVTFTPGTRFMIYSAATVAFGWPTSFGL